MLSHISIQNYALIDFLEINFSEGFSVITGETGAGKRAANPHRARRRFRFRQQPVPLLPGQPELLPQLPGLAEP